MSRNIATLTARQDTALRAVVADAGRHGIPVDWESISLLELTDGSVWFWWFDWAWTVVGVLDAYGVVQHHAFGAVDWLCYESADDTGRCPACTEVAS
jgi:hypothetical protein